MGQVHNWIHNGHTRVSHTSVPGEYVVTKQISHAGMRPECGVKSFSLDSEIMQWPLCTY